MVAVPIYCSFKSADIVRKVEVQLDHKGQKYKYDVFHCNLYTEDGNNFMHRKWHYTNNISDDDLRKYARSTSQVNTLESFEIGFVVEIYCRIQLLFGDE